LDWKPRSDRGKMMPFHPTGKNNLTKWKMFHPSRSVSAREGLTAKAQRDVPRLGVKLKTSRAAWKWGIMGLWWCMDHRYIGQNNRPKNSVYQEKQVVRMAQCWDIRMSAIETLIKKQNDDRFWFRKAWDALPAVCYCTSFVGMGQNSNPANRKCW
jgi:hypothetical protein